MSHHLWQPRSTWVAPVVSACLWFRVRQHTASTTTSTLGPATVRVIFFIFSCLFVCLFVHSFYLLFNNINRKGFVCTWMRVKHGVFLHTVCYCTTNRFSAVVVRQHDVWPSRDASHCRSSHVGRLAQIVWGHIPGYALLPRREQPSRPRWNDTADRRFRLGVVEVRRCGHTYLVACLHRLSPAGAHTRSSLLVCIPSRL